MSKHTPGPWEVGSLDDTMVVTHSAQIVVAWTRRDRDPFTDEKKYNALLIAAAPELLQILKAILYYDGNDGVPGIQALFKTARSIVNRAEGEG